MSANPSWFSVPTASTNFQPRETSPTDLLGQMVAASISVVPRGKPTLTARSKHRHLDYYQNYCQTILTGFNRLQKFKTAEAIEVHAFFETTDPKLWGKPHRGKPDMTNILKGVEDALIHDDSQVWSEVARKLWAPESRMEIRLYGVETF